MTSQNVYLLLCTVLSTNLVAHSDPIFFPQQNFGAPSSDDGLKPPKIIYGFDTATKAVDLTKLQTFCKGSSFGFIPDIQNYLQLYDLLQSSKDKVDTAIAIGITVTVAKKNSAQPPTIEWVAGDTFKNVLSYAPFDSALPEPDTQKTYYYKMDVNTGKWTQIGDATENSVTQYTGKILCSNQATSNNHEF